MTRVTAPIAKLTHGLVSRPAVARPAYFAKNVTKVTSALELRAADSRHYDTVETPRSITTTHRPTAAAAPQPSPNRTVPLMQSFRTSAPRPSGPSAIPTSWGAIDTTVIPGFVFSPSVTSPVVVGGAASPSHLTAAEAEAAAAEAASLPPRVPLLPDNFAPNRSGFHAPETPDAPLAAPQINVVAAVDADVAAAPDVAPLTEVEGMGVDGVELRFAHDGDSGPFTSSASSSSGAAGGLRDMWRGLVDDVFSGHEKKKST